MAAHEIADRGLRCLEAVSSVRSIYFIEKATVSQTSPTTCVTILMV